jgi:hypothetical protein
MEVFLQDLSSQMISPPQVPLLHRHDPFEYGQAANKMSCVMDGCKPFHPIDFHAMRRGG